MNSEEILAELLRAAEFVLAELEAELPDCHYSLNPKGSIAVLSAAIEKAKQAKDGADGSLKPTPDGQPQ